MTITLSALLYENGLPNLPVLLVEPHRNHAGVWRVKFNYDNNEPLSMDAAQATKLAVCLCQMGELDFGAEIDNAVESATRYYEPRREVPDQTIRRVAWPKVSKEAIERPKSRKKRRSRQ